MSFFCLLNSLLPKAAFTVKRRGLLALLSIALVISAQSLRAQESSANSTAAAPVAAEQRSDTDDLQPVTNPHQASLQQKNSQAAQTNSAQANSAQINANTAAPIGSGRHLVNVVLALMGIIGLIFALSWFVKRFSHGGFAASSTIKILSTMPLGTRERIVLVDAGGQQLLLGITATNINTLHVFETPIVVDNKADNQSDFSRKLMTILQQKSPLTSMQDSNNKNNSAP